MDQTSSPSKFRSFSKHESSRRMNNLQSTLRDTYVTENSDRSFSYSPSPVIKPYVYPTSSRDDDWMPQFEFFDLNEDKYQGYKSRFSRASSLPEWTLDENGDVRSDLKLENIIEEGLLIPFATDKLGCHFLQSTFFGVPTNEKEQKLRDRICKEILDTREMFLSLCRNIFGNFFLQRIIEFSNRPEQETITKYICSDVTILCLDKSACRVVQTALERMKPRFADMLVEAIPRDRRLMAICTDQNANHVIQKIVKAMPLRRWSFVVEFLCRSEEDNLLNVCQDKYGCRVVQTIVEVLSNNDFEQKREERDIKMKFLHKLMTRILTKCHKLTSNEFANYVIQHIISDRGVLTIYRDAIINKHLLRNLLSMSQEKYASHVVEQSLAHAPLHYLIDMMEEIFDGYVPHPESGKDALDILIFHQFGNYVVQRMLQICCDAISGKRDTILNGVNCREKFETWLIKLHTKAKKEKHRLTRFSSGKKILDILQTVDDNYEFGFYSSFNNNIGDTPPPTTSSMFTSSSMGWQSRRNSISSIDYPF